MILTAHQPVLLPWLGLFAKIAAADTFCIFDGVQFERHGYSNRVKIKTERGAEWITVPVHHGKDERVLLKDARIDNHGPWQRKVVKTIEHAYRKAPYFDDYFPILQSYLTDGYAELAALDTNLLEWASLHLGIDRPWEFASDHNLQGEKSALVLDMCKQLGATKYIFGAMGRDYADVPAFERAGIKVQFQDYKHPTYRQLHGEFVPGLSIIDLLMNEGPRSLEILLGN